MNRVRILLPRMRGFSLIELMIAMLIGTLLMLGVVQIFAASKAAYRLSEGVARVQENARFAMDFLRRDARMAGHFGCKSDQALHLENTLESTLDTATYPQLDFNVSIQGYEAAGTDPGKTLTLPATLAVSTTDNNYSPVLPDYLDAALDNRIAGSDILLLRYLAPEGISVTAGAPNFAIAPTDAEWDDFIGGIATPGLFGIATCDSASVFQAKGVVAKTSVTMGEAKLNTAASFANPYSVGATLYRAEIEAFYVGLNAQGRPSLYRARFVAGPAADAGSWNKEELVEDVENMQLLYGQDQVLDPAQTPSGVMSRQGTAANVEYSLGAASDAWRRVGSMQIGLLLSSPQRANAGTAAAADALMSLGVTLTPPADNRYRSVYQTTVALRNRLFGN